MTTYTAQPNSQTTDADWSDPNTWSADAVPNSDTADVVLPLVTINATNRPFNYGVSIGAESFITRSVTINGGGLGVNAGSLTIAEGLTIGSNGGIGGSGSVESGQTSINDGIISGSLSLSLDDFTNNGNMIGGIRLDYMRIDASHGFINNGDVEYASIDVGGGSFTNNGTLQDGVGISALDGGFTNYSNGTLTGGTYQGGVRLNVGGPIVTDAADLEDDSIEAYDPATDSFDLSQSLRTIAAGGKLVSGGYFTTSLTVAGILQLIYHGFPGSITADQLTVAPGGTVIGGKKITASVVDNGIITDAAGSNLLIAGNVTGTGIIAVAAATHNSIFDPTGGGPPYVVRPSTVELDGAVSVNVVFADHNGRLVLDEPASFTGVLTPTGYGEEIDLIGVGFTGYSYAGTPSGGTLTVDEDGTSIQIGFHGNFNKADFRLSKGTPTLSTDPPNTVIQLVGPAQTGSAFFINDTGDLQNFAGTGSLNFVATGTTTYVGTSEDERVVVDLTQGTVTKYGQLDALLSNINGVQLGRDNSVVIGLSSGTDLLYGSGATDTYYNNGGVDYIQGGAGENDVVGGAGTQIFYGNGGYDVMLGGAVDSFMEAGATAGSVDRFFGNGGRDFVYGGAGQTNLYGSTGLESLTGGAGENKLFGSTQNTASINILTGGSGTDIFYAGTGSNLFYEGAGTDVLAGNAGTDLIYGGSGSSFVYGGSGIDVITTGIGNQYVKAGSGHTYVNDTAAGLHAGRFDYIDDFSGAGSTDLFLPTAVQNATTFVSQNGGTAVLTAASGGTAEIFAAGASVATVQAHTHFTL